LLVTNFTLKYFDTTPLIVFIVMGSAAALLLFVWSKVGEKLHSPKRPSARAYYRVKADASDAGARLLNIDPPRPGRKTYAQRYAETSRMSTSDILERIAERE